MEDHKKALHEFICLFEQIINDYPEALCSDNFDNYKEAVREYNKIADKRYNAHSTLVQIEELENIDDELNF